MRQVSECNWTRATYNIPGPAVGAGLGTKLNRYLRFILPPYHAAPYQSTFR